jgi:hypothetical protein
MRAPALITLLVTAAIAGACGGDDDETASTPAARPPAATAPPPRTETAPETTERERPKARKKRERPPERRRGRAPTVRAGLVVGIGEHGTAMFSSPLFQRLGVRHARLVTAYDTVRVKFEREIVDNWLAAAQAAGVEPFITFAHSRVNPQKLPSVAEYRQAVRAFRKRYPRVRTYAPWNEINHQSQPTFRSPERAAEFYNVLAAECGGCTVLAADVLDQSGVTGYLQRFKRRVQGSPRLWGLHNYSDTNRFRDSGTREVLAAVEGDVWLTETGGIAKFGRSFPYDLQRQARAVRSMFRLARSSPRIKRLYVYNWTGAPRDARFDAGLTTPAGRPRPAYRALARALGR